VKIPPVDVRVAPIRIPPVRVTVPPIPPVKVQPPNLKLLALTVGIRRAFEAGFFQALESMKRALAEMIRDNELKVSVVLDTVPLVQTRNLPPPPPRPPSQGGDIIRVEVMPNLREIHGADGQQIKKQILSPDVLAGITRAVKAGKAAS